MTIEELFRQARSLWPEEVEGRTDRIRGTAELRCSRAEAPAVCDWLFNQHGFHFSGLVVEEQAELWDLIYVFAADSGPGTVLVSASAPLDQGRFRSVSVPVHAADWHEREAEDLFGLVFEGHPQLGDFVLHDDAWQEGVEPMRSGFDAHAALAHRTPQADWRPRRIVQASGAFIMPVGPVFSGTAESAHFYLETIGEEVLRATPRLFYKYRGIERTVRGRTIGDALLVAERFAGTTAFAHALAFSLAVERLCGVQVPERASGLRVFLAELERFRHHLGVIEGICGSTGLVVAANQTALLEEETLRLTGQLAGHRYLFGMTVPGGLSRDLDSGDLDSVVRAAGAVLRRLHAIQDLLQKTSSFLDRLEEVGVVTGSQAREHGMVGPVARGSGYDNDLRRIQPYGAYDRLDFTPASEREGDGYARLRILFAEAEQSVALMGRAVASLSEGPISTPCPVVPGTAVAGVETPRGATWHWLRVRADGRVGNYRLMVPSFANWHGFHTAAEQFAFQDFPIILASFGLSAAESDR